MAEGQVISVKEGEKRLHELEAVLAEGVQYYARGLLQSAMALYMIREQGLYIYAKDDEGRPFTQWNAYVRYASRSLDFKRTSLLDAASAIRMLVALGFSQGEIIESSIDLDPVMQLKSMLEYDRATGQVNGVKNQKLLESLPPGDTLADRVRTAITEIAVLPNPEERRGYVFDLVGDMEYTLKFWGETDLNNVLHLGWSDIGTRGEFGFDVTPQSVLDTVRRLLHIPNYDG
jgi:hypothetical protein